MRFGADASALTRGDDLQELDLLLDRLLAALAVTLAYVEIEWFEQLLGVLVDVYRSAIDSMGNPLRPGEVISQQLMWRVAVGVEALGGLAVRMKHLWAVRPLAMPDRQLEARIREPSWIRHAVTAASWARLLYLAPREEGSPERQIGGPVVAMARQLVERIPALRPDAQVSPFELNSAPEANDKVLDSLIQFDVMWCVMAVAHGGRERHQYPSFASFYSHRAEPAFELLVDEPRVRELVLAGDADKLRDAARTVVGTAWHVSASEGRSPWRSESEKLTEYLAPEQ